MWMLYSLLSEFHQNEYSLEYMYSEDLVGWDIQLVPT